MEIVLCSMSIDDVSSNWASIIFVLMVDSGSVSSFVIQIICGSLFSSSACSVEGCMHVNASISAHRSACILFNFFSMGRIISKKCCRMQVFVCVVVCVSFKKWRKYGIILNYENSNTKSEFCLLHD